MLKKIIIALIVANAFIGIWFARDFFGDIFLKSKEITVETESMINETETEPLETVLSEKAFASGEIKMVIEKDENSLFYFNQNNFLEINIKDSTKKTINSFPFDDLKTIKCTKSGNFCLLWTGEKFFVYDLELKKETELDSKASSVNFNSQEDGLVYLFLKNGNYFLSTSELDGSRWIQLGEINGDKVDIAVSPEGDKIAYFSRNVDIDQSGIFLTSLVDKNLNARVIEGDIIDVLWSPLGDKILFSSYDHSVTPERVQLGYYDLKQKRQYELGLPSIAQKCVWSETDDILYCAVLTSSSPRSFVLEEWYSRDFISRDIFWKIELNNNRKEKLFSDFEKYSRVDAFNLILIKDNLFFVDKISGNLFKRNI